jgi:chromosome segregation ATPase
MSFLSYSQLYQQQKRSESDERDDEPLDIPKLDFHAEYSRAQQEAEATKADIQRIRALIAKERDDFAAEYDRLVQEQQTLADDKCRETDTIRDKIRALKSEIQEITDWHESSGEISSRLAELQAQVESVEQQQGQFIEEINRYTRALLGLGASNDVAGNELLLGGTRLPRFRGQNQKEAAALSQSLYSLRMVLIKRYAESINSGCSVF